jgi:hypothetical protein
MSILDKLLKRQEILEEDYATADESSLDGEVL